MRILMICIKPPFPAKDGASVVMKVSLYSLVRQGHEVSVLLMSTQKHCMTDDDIPEDLKDKVKFYIVPVDTSYTLTRLMGNYLFSGLPFHAIRFNIPKFRTTITQVLNQNEFDLIQLDGLYLTEYLDTIYANSKAKIIFRAHNLEQEIWERMYQNERRLPQKYYLKSLARRHKKYENKVLNDPKISGIICLSGRDARIMKESGVQTPMIVAEYSIDISEISEKKYNTPVQYPLFFIGSMDWTPNIEGINWFLDKVWENVRKKLPGITFCLAGRNMPKGYAANREGIIVMGEVEDAYLFMAQGGIMIAPLLTGGGIRIKIIEGMAMGKPVIATRLALEGNPAQNGSEVIIADTPAAFADSVVLLVNNPEVAQKIGEDAQKFTLSYFDNKSITEKVLDFYRNLIKN